LDLTADYKDISISYGILNVKDNVHYFKVYRGFITDDNSYVAASEWDNIYYPVDSIEVRLEEYNNGKITRSAVLDTTTAIPKEEGAFHNPKQLLYYSNWKLDPERVYRLVIHRNSTGEEVYAETVMVHDFGIKRPMVTWNMNLNQPYKMIFYSAENAAMYDVYLTFYYIEVDNVTKAVTHHQITQRLNGDYIRATTGTEVSFSGFTPDYFVKSEASFITFLKEHITELKKEYYIPYAVDVIVKAGEGSCEVLSTPSHWFGVTFKEDRPGVVAKFASLVEEGVYPSPLY
jgi:hypothetical protein